MTDHFKNQSLPHGWEESQFKDIAAYIQRGKSPKYAVHSNFPVINQKCIRWHGINLEFLKYLDPNESHKWSQERYLQPGDILWNSTGTGTIGRASIYKGNIENAVADSHVTIIRLPTHQILPEYVLYFIMSPYVQKNIENMQSGSTDQVELGKSVIEETKIPLPPFAEQKRIVAKIEELFSEIDMGIENLLKAEELLKAYQQSLIKNAATGRLLISLNLLKNSFDDSYKITLSKVISKYGQGWSPKCLNEPSTNENDWAVIKTTAIQNFEFLEDENKLLPKNLKPKSHLEIATGDILVTRAGPRNRVGIACLVRECRKRLILCDKAYRIKVNHDMILPEYLEMLLNSPHIIDEIEYLKTGINDSGVNLTQERFLALELIVPPLSLQKLTLQKLQDNISTATQLNQQINIASEKLKNIRQSILKKAFSGELVSQDTTDESAIVLLERIKAEKISPRPQKRKSKQPQKVAV
jgi:type I restriction enzyme, S subunit